MPDGTTYSAADIVGRTLTARKELPVYAAPWDNQPVVAKVLPGQVIGVVHGYVNPKPAEGRNYLYWEFKDGSDSVWVRHSVGNFDVQDLQEQGVLTTMQKIEAETDENLPWYEKLIKNYGGTLLLGVGVITVAAASAKGYFSRAKSL